MSVKKYKKSKLPSWFKKSNYTGITLLSPEDLICLINDRFVVYSSYLVGNLDIKLCKKVLKEPLSCHKSKHLHQGLKINGDKLYLANIKRRPVIQLDDGFYSLNVDDQTITVPSTFVDIDSSEQPRMLFLSDLSAQLDDAVEAFKKSYKEVQAQRKSKVSKYRSLLSFSDFVNNHHFIEYLDLELYSIICNVGYSDSDFVKLLQIGKDRSTYNGVLKPKFEEVMTRQFIDKLLNMI